MPQAKEIIEVWVTKYALTTGIKKVKVQCNTDYPNMVSQRNSNGMWEYFHGKDWHCTREEAVARAKEMQAKQLATLKKRMAHIETLRFE